MGAQDLSRLLQEQVRAAISARTPLNIVGGNTKTFYGREPQGLPIEVAAHSGIVNYEPTELVITARAGTPLQEIEQTLATENQMLPFEPPHFGRAATLGGTIACNLSGPRRPYSGAARDLVLGTRLLNGKGEILRFGGEVMKNVAGYDVSRLMAGALGTLGILLGVSVKVLPRAETELTLRQETGPEQALERLHGWAREPLPVSGSGYRGGFLSVRLSGTPDAVNEARGRIGGEEVSQGETFWQALKEQQLPFFALPGPLWRLSVAPDTPPMDLPGDWLYEWGGALRWLKSEVPAEQIRAAAEAGGGHATLFRGGDRDQVFHPLSAELLRLHCNLKQAFDPHGIFNPGRMYPDF
jgi:glycolate oxidase FAD binding subunit